ncbi:ArgS-related anticodon-binding protein NrtL [Streptomyces pristinaespiralis]|uniref:arginine--tRNA ligase n=2 Tax=Streptomyces pristinaespiralis TaxID=38300 RepID=A0A0M5IT72_STRPR|nr:DALR anticodon-binding domain-containing protein [Streptomyces pristinaespiralis]ALC20844.1 arginyl-tRNA synthetase [Streptomyces pristinaespiralis]QMU16349.1 arginine--tRNA ligase [Streptomyces pristinaespiralis]
MTPAELSRTVRHAVCRAVEDGALRVDAPRDVKVERPRPGGRGDYATGIALRLARQAGRPAVEVAAELGHRIAAAPGIAAVDITGPGFLNITLEPDTQQGLVRDVLERGEKYGWTDLTGAVEEITYRADVRAAVIADTLRRIRLSQGTPSRTLCEGAADPGWAGLGVRIEAEHAHGRPRTDVAPVPAADDAATLLRRLGVDATRWGLLAAAAHDRPLTDHPTAHESTAHEPPTHRPPTGPSPADASPTGPSAAPTPARPADRRSATTHPRATAHTPHPLLLHHERNPLFRVRYAHARARALSRNAAQLGFAGSPDEHVDAPALTAAVGGHPAVLADAARLGAPDRLARHLEVTADALLSFQSSAQHSVLPVGDEKPSAAHRSRLALAEAAGTVLAGGLSLLGISAPDHL